MKFTLPTDSNARKLVPILGGVVRYFPAALAGAATHSKGGNDKHNPGEPLHHARGKSMDHEECIQRHLIDLQDLRAYLSRSDRVGEGHVEQALLTEVNALCWRALALSQELHEQYAGAPLAPGARLPDTPPAAVPPPTASDRVWYAQDNSDDGYIAALGCGDWVWSVLRAREFDSADAALSYARGAFPEFEFTAVAGTRRPA
jgi:hypothetical protein